MMTEVLVDTTPTVMEPERSIVAAVVFDEDQFGVTEALVLFE